MCQFVINNLYIELLNFGQTLLQILTLLETAVKRDFLSSNFAATEELLGTGKQSEAFVPDFLDSGSVPLLPWIPHTTAAVALRLHEMDSSITHIQLEKAEPNGDKEVKEYLVSVPVLLSALIEGSPKREVERKSGV